ncbi:hypothetical protein U9M48_035990 [Paspalum notatum var. saurae]|uniref:Uncharacterized protein n=1 Tax=Paspalum notatum var. saurae TaxID=547442 RepID=A0AAQ3UD77_PASNO
MPWSRTLSRNLPRLHPTSPSIHQSPPISHVLSSWGLCRVICFFLAQAVYRFKPTVMLPGLVISLIPLIVDIFLHIVFFLVVPSLLGRLRSRHYVACDMAKLDLTKHTGADVYTNEHKFRMM